MDKKEPKSRRQTALLYTDANRNRYWTVTYTNAKDHVRVPIHFAKGLLRRAKRGVPWECIASCGIQDYAEANPTMFPHPVLHVYVTRRVLYIVTRIKGTPTHAVRYWHDFGKLTAAFDTTTKQQFIKKFGERGFNLLLRPAKKRGGTELPGARETRVRTKRNPSAPASRGAMLRAQAAGLEPSFSA